MKVKDVMTTSVASVRKNESLSAAAQLMWDCDCGSVPVKDEDGEQVIGMITDRDICIATWSRNLAPSAIAISEVMSGDPLYFAVADDPIATVENLMRSRQIRRLPVLDHDRRLIGILSLADIATEAERIGSHAAEEVGSTAVAETLAGISRRRVTRQTAAST